MKLLGDGEQQHHIRLDVDAVEVEPRHRPPAGTHFRAANQRGASSCRARRVELNDHGF
ncbi:MAG: hypothetical protein U0575_05685 [Phycisphaerales bacterium]